MRPRTHLLVAALAAVAGCGPSAASERSGPAMRDALPAPVARLVPEDAVLCYQSAAEGPARHRLWIFRAPAGGLIDLPEDLPGFERHPLPPGALETMIAAKAPWLEPGASGEQDRRFFHWKDGASEYQAREIATDRGWFASFEQVAPADAGRG